MPSFTNARDCSCPPDDPSSLAGAIVRLLRDRPFAQRLASQGRAHALELFTLTKAIDDLDALYTRELKPAVRGYRLWRSAWRALYLAVWGWRLDRADQADRGGARGALRPTERRYVSHASDAVDVGSARASHRADGGHRPERRLAGVDLPRSAREGRRRVGGHRRAGRNSGAAAARSRHSLSVDPALVRARQRTESDACWSTRCGFHWRSSRLARLFRRERVDVVHTHVFNTIMIGRLAAWLARVPFRVSMVPGPLHLEAPFTRWADRLTWWMDHHVIAGSAVDTRPLSRARHERASSRLRLLRRGRARFDPARADRGSPAPRAGDRARCPADRPRRLFLSAARRLADAARRSAAAASRDTTISSPRRG